MIGEGGVRLRSARLLATAVSAVFALQTFAMGQTTLDKPQDGELILRCKQILTHELTREVFKDQIWFIVIKGDDITIIESSSSVERVYKFYKYRDTKEEILGRNKDTEFNEIRIDRISGRLTWAFHYSAEASKNLWNEEKGQVGGFDGGATLTARYDCKKSERAF